MVTYCYLSWKKIQKKNIKLKKIGSIFFVSVCVVHFVLSNPSDELSLPCCDFENIDYMLRLLVVCFGFNLHNLWLLEISCTPCLCQLIDCNLRSIFRLCIDTHTLKCEDLSPLIIHMYAFFIHSFSGVHNSWVFEPRTCLISLETFCHAWYILEMIKALGIHHGQMSICP